MDKALRDSAVLLLVNGLAVDAVENALARGGRDPEEVRAAVTEARKKITIAADYSREEQIGRAFLRLDDLYSKSAAGKDFRTALQTQKEINRLLDLYSGRESAPVAGTGEADKKLELIASYILPLALMDPSYPLEEHVRLACQLIRENGYKRV